MHGIRSSRDGSNAVGQLITLLAVLAASAGCRSGDRPIVFPPDPDATVPHEGGGSDAGMHDAGRQGSGHPGSDASMEDAGRDAAVPLDATVDSATPEVNHAPVALGISVQTDEDLAVSDTLPASDEDGDAVSYAIVTQPAHGTLVLDKDSGNITYTPAANYHGTDSFTFHASDGMDDSAIATVDIEILAVNDAPVATGSSVTGEEDTEINPLSLTASDVDGDTLSFAIVDAPGHGLLSGSGSTRIYTPDPNFAGADEFTFRVSDGKVNSMTATVAIEITASNDLPIVVGEGIDVIEGGTATTLAGGATSVLANDSDVESTLTVNTTPVTAPTHGTLTLNVDGTFSYTHDGSETIADSFQYSACDDAATPGCSTGTVNIAISPVDDAPLATADALTVAEGGTATTLAGGATSVIANDAEAEGEALTVNTTPVTAPSNGTLTLNADGTFSYTHDGSETTSDSFSYQVCDAAPVLCATATVTITVTPVNETPTANDDTIAVNEGATATTLVANSDDSLLDNDSDPDGDTLSAAVVSDVTHGTLTLNADGTFSYVHDGTETTSDSFTYTACDGAGSPLCDTATVTIAITPVNDSPIAVTDAIDTTEGGTVTTLSGGGTDLRANDTDAESGALTVNITPVAQPAHGAVTLLADGTFSYTHDGGESTSDSFQYQVCDPSSACATGTVNVTIAPVNDTPVAVDDVIVVSEAGVATMTFGAGASDKLTANDLDPELQTLTVTLAPVAGPANGTLTLVADGTFSYTHDGSQTTSDSFDYEVCDPSVACDVGTVTITIVPVNDAPVVGSETITVGEGLAASVLDSTDDSVLDNDSDPDGDALTATVDTQPTHGTLVLAGDGTFTYTHDGSETTSDSFVYEVCDDALLTPLCTTGTVAITVTPINDAPVAVDDTATVSEGGTVTLLTGAVASLIANDTDADSSAFTVSLWNSASHGGGGPTVNPDGTFSYTHDGSEGASDSFDYQICDDALIPACDVGTVTITITPVNDAPDAVDDTITVAEGGTVTQTTAPASAVTANDTDAEPGALVVTLVGGGTSNGALQLNPDGTFSYTHDGSETTTDSFQYQACDSGALCDIANVSITITPVNDTPVAGADTIDVAEGGTATALSGGGTDLRANDTDAESASNALTVSTIAAGAPAHGSVTLNGDGTFSYTHDGSETTSDSFQYFVCDLGACGTGLVTVTITPVNDAPVAVTDSIALNEAGTATTLVGGGTDLRANDTDAESAFAALTVTTTPVVGPTHGTLTLVADGTFSYTHDGSQATSDSFQYQVCDPSAACGLGVVNIAIVPVNDAPVAGSETITVGEGLTATALVSTDDSVLDNDSDPDGDGLSATVDTQPMHGTLTLNPDGTFSYTHDGSETVSDSFVYEVCDDALLPLCTTSTVAITVTPINDAPVAVDDSATVAEGGTVTLLTGAVAKLTANDSDVDSAAFTVSLASPAAHANALTVNPDGTFSYTHDGSEGGSDSFDYRVCDDALIPACDVGTVTITVTPVNDAPDAIDDVITVAEGGTATQLSTPAAASSVTANDTDAENNALTVSLLGFGTTHGSLTLNPDGTFSYTHDGSETSSDTFQYQACDGGPLCDTATVSIVITPVNDAPVAGADAITVAEGATATTLFGGGSDLRANDTDPESAFAALSVNTSAVSAPAHGSVTLNANGTFSYTHDGSETTSDSFQYSVCDPGSACGTGLVTITITPVNDAPVGVTDGVALNEAGTATTLVGGGSDLRANDTDAESAFAALTVTTTPVVGPLHGVVTLAANGTFSYTHDGTETTSDSFQYQVCDPSSACGTGTVNIAITPVNEPPFAVVDLMTVNEGGTVTLLDNSDDSLLDNDSDPDGDTLTAAIDVLPAHGTVTINPDGTFSYTHDGSETALDTFTYKACDGAVIPLCTSAGVVITVNAVNDNPVAVTDGYIVAESSTTVIPAAGVLINDTDAENGALSATVATGPSHAAAFTLNLDGSFTYTQNGDESASDSFSYKVCDDVLPIPGCSIGTVNFTVTPVNDAPVAVDDSIAVNEGAASSTLASGATSLGANDTDAENDPRTYALFGGGTTHGTIVVNGDGTFLYTHDGSESVADSFDYEVCDGPSSCDVGSVSIVITPVNDPADAVDDAFTVAEGGTATLLTGGANSVLANDTDVDSTLVVNTVTVQPQHAAPGGFTLNPNGTFTYTHDGSETVSDSFTYEVCDGALPCDTATVLITITPVDDAPVGVPDGFTIFEGGTATTLSDGSTGVIFNDTDAENDSSFVVLLSGPSHGALPIFSGTQFSYTHDGSENFSDSFTYQVCEFASPSTCSGSTLVTITITPVDDAPIAGDDAITVNEGATATTLAPSGTDLRANDTDAENNAFTVNTTPVTPPIHGNLTLNANGTFSYVHDGGESTSDSFVYRVCETLAPAVCDDAAVAITINPVNDAPVGGSYSYGNVVGNTLYTVGSSGAVDSGLLLGSLDSDAEAGSVLTVSSIDAASAQGGTVTNAGAGRFTYLPPVGYLGADTFHYRVSDNGTPVQTTDVTVSLTVVGPMIWYVNASAGPGNTGRSSQPFISLASADAAATPIADTRIYVRPGTYNSTVALVAGQTLHGAGDAFAPSVSVTFTATTRPLISVAGNAVTVTSNNSVHGLDITSTTGNAINGPVVSGTLAISNAILTASAGTALNLSGGAAVALGSLGTITGLRGIVTSGLSGLTTAGPNAISATGGPALDINGGTLNVTFGAVSSVNSNTFGVQLQGNGGSPSFTASSVTVTNPTAGGIAISGATGGSFTLGSCNVTQAGTAVTTAGDAYAFTTSPTTSFSLSIAADPATQNGRGFFAQSTGTVTIASVPATFSATGGAAIDLRSSAGNVASSGHWRFNTLSSTNSTAEGIKLLTLSTPVEAQGTTTITNAFSESIRSDSTTGDLTFGTVNINTRRNAGIFINSANNSLVAFGAVTIPNPNARAENAFQIQSSNANVSVLSTTISGASTALRLLNNGGGSFTLNSPGGVLGDGGTISASSAAAVLIDTCTDISFDDLKITNAANTGTFGIDANGVDDFVLRNSEVRKLGDGDNEHAVALSAVTGNVLFDNDVITEMAEDGIELINSTGTANVRILNTDVSHNDANTFCSGSPCSGDGLDVTMNGNAALNLLVDGGLFEFLDTEGIQVIANTSGTVNATIRNSTFPNGGNGDSAIELDQLAGTMRYDIDSNVINDWAGHVLVAAANPTAGTLTYDGTIRNNTIVGTPLFLNDGIRVLADLVAGVTFTGKVAITGNNVSKVDGRGIATVIRGAATGSILHSRILGNTVSQTTSQDVTVAAQTSNTACARVGDVTHVVAAERNSATAPSGGANAYQINRTGTSVFQFEGAAPATEIPLANTGVTTSTVSATITLVAANTCLSPTLPILPP